MRHTSLLIYFIFGLTSFSTLGEVVDFNSYRQNPNTATTVEGNTVKINKLTSLDKTAKTANAVIDARDKFGNNFRINKTLNINAAKFKRYATSCLRSPALCAASVGIGYGLTELMGWYFDAETGDVNYVMPGEAFPGMALLSCQGGWEVESYRTFESGAPYEFQYSALIRIPYSNCVTSQKLTYSIYRIPVASGVKTHTMTRAERDDYYAFLFQGSPWNLYADNVAFTGYVEGVGWDGDGARYNIFSVFAHVTVSHAPNVYPDPVGQTVTEVTPEQFTDALLSPEAIQMAPAEYPDIFDPVDLSTDTPPETDPSDLPDTIGGSSSDLDLVGAEIIPEEIFNMQNFFSGESFLSSECPEPVVIEMPFGDSFEISFVTICDYSVIVRNFVILAGMMSWLIIVWRGLNDS